MEDGSHVFPEKFPVAPLFETLNVEKVKKIYQKFFTENKKNFPNEGVVSCAL